MSQTETDAQLHLYWATGCTSCLRAKEFLERNDVSFISHNVVEDKTILEEMAGQGMPQQVPLVKYGDDWADAQILEEVARIAGIEHETEPLPVEELYRRLKTILNGAQRYLKQVPEGKLQTDIPNRPRSYGELTFHIFSIPESFLEHTEGVPIRSCKREPEWASRSKAALETYGEHIRVRLRDWHESQMEDQNWSEPADVYYGDPTVHAFFERTAWHAGQHTRQLEWILENKLGVDLEPLDSTIWEDLPMPQKVWDAV